MTPSNGNSFLVTGPLCGEFTDHRWIPLSKASDDVLKYIFFNENVLISFLMSLKFVSKFRINSIPALVQIMAWRRSGQAIIWTYGG